MSRPAGDVNTGGQARRWTVHGRVQGVGFRMFVLEHALQSGLSGYVRNLPDGAVEVVASGAAEAMDKLEASLLTGPQGARVDRVEESRLQDGAELPSPFEVRA